jgi:hypothetical protein
MVIAAPASLSGVALAQDTPQSHAHPAIQSREGPRVAVLKLKFPLSSNENHRNIQRLI